MKKVKNWKMLVMVALLAIIATAATLFAEEKTIVEIASGDDRFDTLVAAVVAADLADTLSGGEYTVFAPTDDAFAKLGLNPSNIGKTYDKATLTDILLYHVIVGEVNSDKAKTATGDVTMANGAKAGLKVFNGDIYINDESKVILADVNASNGVIHAVDTVILGPWPKSDDAASDTGSSSSGSADSSSNSIVDIAVNDDRFDTLVAAVVATGLADTLSGGEYTVFAPTDAAFAKLGLNADNIASTYDKATLTDILLYHVIAGEVNSDKAKTLAGDVTMANGAKAGLKVFNGDIFINDESKVIVPDVDASNGVIHAVDTVILGPWPKSE